MNSSVFTYLLISGEKRVGISCLKCCLSELILKYCWLNWSSVQKSGRPLLAVPLKSNIMTSFKILTWEFLFSVLYQPLRIKIFERQLGLLAQHYKNIFCFSNTSITDLKISENFNEMSTLSNLNLSYVSTKYLRKLIFFKTGKTF